MAQAKTLPLIVLLALAACGDLAVDPVEVEGNRPEWCNAFAPFLAGEWTRDAKIRGHDYTSTLTLAETEPCVFDYSVDMVQIAHGGEGGMTVYETHGQLVVTGYEADGPVERLAVHGIRQLEQTYGDNGATVRNEAPAIFERGEITLWGESLKLWGNTYQRKAE